ncbi:MAG TPA: phosphatase PAP2 family protein [Gemmatales bacterium]|nr:phosphatase PAP2 family protein [Gemmatales bacterium]
MKTPGQQQYPRRSGDGFDEKTLVMDTTSWNRRFVSRNDCQPRKATMLSFITAGSELRRPLRSKQLVLETLEDRLVLSSDIVLEWNHMALDAMVNDSYLGANAKQAGPDRSSRALAIVSGAVYDAVNSIDGSYAPYLIKVKAPQGASMDAAAAQAAHDALVALYPDFQTQLDTQLAADLALIGPSSARDAGVEVGHTVAAAILTARANDGSNAPMHYDLNSKLGTWQPDPLHPGQMPVGPEWGNVTPFAILSTTSVNIPPPPKLTSQQYADAFNEVKNYGGDGVTTPTIRTAEQTEIGIFWGYDGSRGLSTPPRLYNQIAETIAIQQGNSEVQNARLFALVNFSMADAGIACWNNKYDYEFWRPVTGIRAGDVDGNANTVGDANWLPLGAPNDNGGGTNFTPPFPAYASGHATFGAALFETLTRFYGTNNISFTISSDEFNGITKDQNGIVRPVVTRSFTSFSQAQEENGQSRIYLGIHWKFDKEQGIKQGKSIADFVFGNYLKPQKARVNTLMVQQFQAVQALNGTIVLTTTNGKPASALLTSLPRVTTITTTVGSTHDAPVLVTDLMNTLTRGVWGGAARKGKVLSVDLTQASGVTISVDPCAYLK